MTDIRENDRNLPETKKRGPVRIGSPGYFVLGYLLFSWQRTAKEMAGAGHPEDRGPPRFRRCGLGKVCGRET